MFWFSIVLFVIAALWFIFAPSKFPVTVEEADHYRNKDAVYKNVTLKPLGFIFVAFALLFLVISCFTVVGARTVGVEKFFSATTGRTMSTGVHAKLPWNGVEDIDAKIKPEEYHGANCIKVKIADGGTACVSVAYRWRVNPDGAAKIYADYGSSDDVDGSVRKALVSTNIKAAINEVLGKFNPLSGADITPSMSPAQLAAAKINVVPDYEQINNDIRNNVDEKIAGLGDLIQIESVTVSGVDLPESTQAKIIKFNQAAQDTKIAIQHIATASAQATANEKLQTSVKDPNVLVSKCLDGLEQGDIKNEPGFSCWPGNNGAVVVPSK